MTLREKLRCCEKFIIENGYPDASIYAEAGSEMIIFSVPNITAKYPNERATISVEFENGNKDAGDVNFDVMQILCFIANGVPKDRLDDIQKFCADFNKTMQIGYFSVDFKNEGVYFKCAQVINENIIDETLTGLFNQIFTMLLFYFGYAYEILIELSYGIIGYGATSMKLQERKRMLAEAMAELHEEKPKRRKNRAYQIDRNIVIEEMLTQLSQDDPDILENVNITMSDIENFRRKTKKQVSAEDAAMKLIEIVQNDNNTAEKRTQTDLTDDLPIEVKRRTTVKDDDAPQYKSQMPSVEMFTQREKNKSVPSINKDAREEKTIESTEHSVSPVPERPVKKENSESLVQRLRNWTQNS
jgi:hypothetical protein